jgi:hypothetical protein
VAGSQSYPSLAAEPNPDGSTTLCLAPEQLEGVARGNWIQAISSRGIVAKGKLREVMQHCTDRLWHLDGG